MSDIEVHRKHAVSGRGYDAAPAIRKSNAGSDEIFVAVSVVHSGIVSEILRLSSARGMPYGRQYNEDFFASAGPLFSGIFQPHLYREIILPKISVLSSPTKKYCLEPLKIGCRSKLVAVCG